MGPSGARDALDIGMEQLGQEASQLLAAAAKRLDEESTEEAERAAREALALFRELGDRESATRALRLIVASYRLRDDTEAIVELALDNLERAEERQDRYGEAAMLLTLAELNRDRHGDEMVFEEVLRTAIQAQAIFQELGSRVMVAEVLLALCELYHLRDQGTSLMQTANGALSLYRSLQDRRGEGRALHYVAIACGLQQRFPESLKNALAARGLFVQAGARRLEAQELQVVAQAYQMLKDYKQMLKHAEESLELLRQLIAQAEEEGRPVPAAGQQPEAAAVALVVEAHSLLGDESRALAAAEEALQRYEAPGGSKKARLAALDSVVACHVARKDAARALQRAEEALELARDLEDVRWEAAVLHTIANVHLEERRLDEALDTLLDAIALMQDAGDVNGEASARLSSLVNLHLAAGAPEEALKAASEAEELYRGVGDRKGQASARLVMGKVCQLMGRLDSAEKWAKDALASSEELGDVALQMQAKQVLVMIHIAAQRPEQATELAYQGHVMSQREKDRHQEINMLLLIVQSHFASLKKFADAGGTRPSREFDNFWNKAEKAAVTASKLAGPLGDKELIGNTSYTLGEVNLVNGKLKEALQSADEAIKMHKDVGLKAAEGTAHVLRAQVLKHCGRAEEAVGAAQEGLALAQACEDRQLQALAEQLLDSIRGGPLPTAPVGMARPRAPQQEEQPTEAAAAAPPVMSQVIEEKPKGFEPEVIHDLLHTMLREMMGMEVESDTPFMDAGVDSLMSIEFRSQVNQAFSGLNLSNTLTFDYPTVRELSAHIVEKSHV